MVPKKMKLLLEDCVFKTYYEMFLTYGVLLESTNMCIF